MRVEIKKLVEKKWKPVPLEDLIGLSVAEYINNQEHKATAAAYDEEGKPILFISNDQDTVEKLKKKATSMNAANFIILFAPVEKADLVAGCFKGSKFIERTLTDKVS